MGNEDNGRLEISIFLGGSDVDLMMNVTPANSMFPTDSDVSQMAAPLDEIAFHEGDHANALMRGELPNDTQIRQDPSLSLRSSRPAIVGPLMRPTTAPEKSAIDATNGYRALKGAPYRRVDHSGTLRAKP